MNRKKLVRRTVAALKIRQRYLGDFANADDEARRLFGKQLVWAVRHHKLEVPHAE